MPRVSPFADYLREVSEQVRWKQARPALAAELEAHLVDQAAAYEEHGMSAEAARAEALRQMGDPVMVGQALDEVHRPKAQWGALAVLMALALAGMALQLHYMFGLGVWTLSVSQVVGFTAMGIAAAVVLHVLDCQAFLARYAWVVFGVAVGAACFIALAADVNSYMTLWAHSAHSLTLTFPLVLALVLYACRGRGWRGFCAVLGCAVVMTVLAAYFGDVPQLLIMLVAVSALMTYAIAVGWFGVARTKAAVAFVAGGVMLAAFVLATGVAYEYYRWVFALLEPGHEPFGHFFMPLFGDVAFRDAKWVGAATSMSGYYMAPAGAIPDAGQGFLTSDVYLVTSLYQVGRLPMLAFVVAVMALAVWVLVRTLRQGNRLCALCGIAVFVTIAGSALVSLAPFAFGIVFSSSVFPLLTPGFHSVVAMALAGVALSALRNEQLPRAEGRLAYA